MCVCVAILAAVSSSRLQKYESRVAELEDMVARQSEVGSVHFSDEEEDLYGTSLCAFYCVLLC